MAKLLFIVLVTILLVLWFKSMARPKRDSETERKTPVEDMVRCKACGVILPRSEAILSQGSLYCCDEHRRREQG